MTNRVKTLTDILTQAAIDYYENGTSILTDAQYDMMFEELRLLDPTNEIFKSCGKGYSVPDNEKEKFQHPIEIGSIDFRSKDLNKILSKLDKDATFSIKIDGNSTVDYYQNGMIKDCATRGSENIGIKYTKKFIECGLAPSYIEELKEYNLVCVRGEMAIPKKKYTTENGFKDISKSSRNAVTGAISRLEDYKDILKYVDSIKYTFIDCETNKEIPNLPWDKYFKIEKQQPVFKNGVAVTLEELKKLVEEYEYDCDGIVFKNPDGELFAFKFEDEHVDTEIEELEIEIGSAQRLTPVARLTPVNLSGSIISRASLGSMAVAQTLGAFPLYSKTVARVIRSGAIIPNITQIVSHGSEVIQNKILCPVCGEEGKFKGAHMFCVNPECPNIESEYLYKFCSFLSPEGLDSKTLARIFEEYCIESVEDLLVQIFDEHIHEDDLTGTDGIGLSKQDLFRLLCENILSPINSKIIYQTFINGCGKRASRAIVNCRFDFNNYAHGDYTTDTLEKLPNFNSNIIDELEEKQHIMEMLVEYLEVYDEVEIVGEKTFCVTGVRLSPEQLALAKSKGWEEKSGVSKNLNLLVAKNPKSNSGKPEKARSLGVKIVSLEEFLKDIQ